MNRALATIRKIDAISADPEIRGAYTSVNGCAWTYSEYDGWETGCGNVFVIIDGNPRDNGMAFCCYCGKPLVENPERGEG